MFEHASETAQTELAALNPELPESGPIVRRIIAGELRRIAESIDPPQQ